MGPSARRFGWLLAIVVALAAACGDPAVPPVPVAPSGTIAAPEITCLGVVPAKCREIVGDIQGGNPDNQPVAIRIVCTAAPCTELAGQVSIDLVGADGTRSSSGMGWATAGGGGPLPPVPHCRRPRRSRREVSRPAFRPGSSRRAWGCRRRAARRWRAASSTGCRVARPSRRSRSPARKPAICRPGAAGPSSCSRTGRRRRRTGPTATDPRRTAVGRPLQSPPEHETRSPVSVRLARRRPATPGAHPE